MAQETDIVSWAFIRMVHCPVWCWRWCAIIVMDSIQRSLIVIIISRKKEKKQRTKDSRRRCVSSPPFPVSHPLPPPARGDVVIGVVSVVIVAVVVAWLICTKHRL